MGEECSHYNNRIVMHAKGPLCAYDGEMSIRCRVTMEMCSGHSHTHIYIA